MAITPIFIITGIADRLGVDLTEDQLHELADLFCDGIPTFVTEPLAAKLIDGTAREDEPGIGDLMEQAAFHRHSSARGSLMDDCAAVEEALVDLREGS